MGYNCKSVDSSKDPNSDCYSISITDSTFSEYNLMKVSRKDEVSLIEGVVVNVHNLDGPITIRGNTFEKMLTYNSYDSAGSGSFDFYDCRPRAYTHNTMAGDFSSLFDEIDPWANYREDNWKLFMAERYAFLKAQEFLFAPTTSVISVRNATKGLTIHDNTFDKILTRIGGSIYVEGFKNTLSK